MSVMTYSGEVVKINSGAAQQAVNILSQSHIIRAEELW